jgi:hypothetical protein
MTNPKHTLVLHLSPDIEVLFMTHLIRGYEAVRDRLSVIDSPRLKFIPAGPLRKEDWPGESDLSATALEEKGYLFLDCGKGSLDQHGRPENEARNSISSLDLLVHAVDLDEIAPHLMPIVALISRNDLNGQDIAPKRNWKGTATPHTPRHLRNMILGWNLLHRDRPAEVVRMADAAFGCITRLVDKAVVDGTEGVDVREHFLFEEMLKGTMAHFRTVMGLSAPEQELFAACEGFRKDGERALRALEDDWNRGVRDYWHGSTRVRKITVAKRTEQGVAYEHLTMAVGRSPSTRFGAVTRLGNDRYRPAHPGKAPRAKADVTVQFYDQGSFVISTKGLRIERVAQAIRETDLRRRGVSLTEADAASLSKPGHLRFTDAFGREQEALYLAEYRTAFGNGFRANPFAAKTPLKDEEIVELIVKALASVD